MSVNDLLDDESFLPTLLILFVICFFVTVIGIAIGKAKNKAEQNSYPIETCTGKILSKRTAPHPKSPYVMVNYVLFELSSGTRVELMTGDNEVFGTMLEGDSGTVTYQGKKLISFNRTDRT